MLAVLDWELSTLGYPLADLAYSAMPYRLASGSLGLAGLPTPLPEGAQSCSRHPCPARRGGVLCLSEHWRGTGLSSSSALSFWHQTPGRPLRYQATEGYACRCMRTVVWQLLQSPNHATWVMQACTLS